MKVSFYCDEMMSRTATDQIIQRGYTVIMANDVGMTGKDDDTEHLPYAAGRGLVVVTFDRAFAGRASKRADHAGLICLSGSQNDIGLIVRTLIEFAEQHTPEDAIGRVFWR